MCFHPLIESLKITFRTSGFINSHSQSPTNTFNDEEKKERRKKIAESYIPASTCPHFGKLISLNVVYKWTFIDIVISLIQGEQKVEAKVGRKKNIEENIPNELRGNVVFHAGKLWILRTANHAQQNIPEQNSIGGLRQRTSQLIKTYTVLNNKYGAHEALKHGMQKTSCNLPIICS